MISNETRSIDMRLQTIHIIERKVDEGRESHWGRHGVPEDDIVKHQSRE